MDVVSRSADYVVVGGGMAGFYAAVALRKSDASGKILLVGEEPHLPYDRVPLSKDYLIGRRPRDKVFLRNRDFYDQQGIELLQGVRATKLNPEGRSIRLENETEISFNRLLLATGSRPRMLTLPGSDLDGIHYLRTIDDCERMRAAMLRSKRAVVIGAGFIGCEVASIFASSGLHTTIVEAASHPLSVALDSETGMWVADYFAGKGVNVIVDTQISSFMGDGGKVVGVQTDNGKTFEADFVAVGIGVVPNTELAEGAGLGVERGILTNEHLETDHEGIYAAGDVARFHSPIFNKRLRVEHYDVAMKQGTMAGTNMAGGKEAFRDLPFFYSYSFDLRIRAYGDLTSKNTLVRRGALSAKAGFFLLFFDEGVLNGFLSVNGSFPEGRELIRVILSRRIFSDTSELAEESKNLKDF